MQTVTWQQVVGRRVRRQLLTEPGEELVATASRLGGVHAQVAASAEQILGVRCPAVTPERVSDALWRERTLVKTWGMRGTLHLFPAAELPTWVAAFRSRQWPPFTPAWERYHGVTPDELRDVTGAIGELLPGRQLTREELAAAVAERLGKPALVERIRSGWGVMLKPAAAGGLLCFGESQGRNVTFASPRDWVSGDWREPSFDEALTEVVARFLDVYGPASHEDFARWWGVDPKTGRELLTGHADGLVQVSLDGAKAWTTAEAAGELADTEPARGVWLLPGFDPYVTAPISHRRWLIPDGYVDRVSRTAGWISPVLVVDGMIRGVWSPQRGKAGATFTITPFAPVSATVRRAAERHAETYAPLLGVPVTVRWE
ncbi:MAG: winged helix DNA-binding domain-containing protein [Micromonosporaceae bacterium]